jgi:hypothetical protein
LMRHWAEPWAGMMNMREEEAGSAGAAQPTKTPEPVKATGAGAEQHAREEIAGLEAGVERRARHLVRWLAVPAGALAGWLMACRQPRG